MPQYYYAIPDQERKGILGDVTDVRCLKKAIGRRGSGYHPGLAGIFGEACGGAYSRILNNRIADKVHRQTLDT